MTINLAIIGSDSDLFLFGVKPLSEPCWLIINWTIKTKSQRNWNHNTFHSRKCIWRCLQNGSHSCLDLNVITPHAIIWWHRPGSTLAQAQSHYLNHYWLFIKGVLWHSSASNFTQKVLMNFIHTTCSKITLLKLLPHLLGTNQLNSVTWTPYLVTWQLQVFWGCPCHVVWYKKFPNKHSTKTTAIHYTSSQA